MSLKALLLLGLCLWASQSFIVLQGKNIPKNYSIGYISKMDFIGTQKIFFYSTNHIFGYLQAKTGSLIKVYELEKSQKILDFKGANEIIIAKGNDINIFFPKVQKYVKLQYSQYLQKQTFKQIIAFKRFIFHDYILTDQFLLKAQNPNAANRPHNENNTNKQQVKTQKFQIIQKKTDKDEKYFDLIFLVGKNKQASAGIGLVSIKKIDSKNKMCLKRFLTVGKQLEKLCYELDQAQELQRVIEVGEVILVMYKTYKVVLNHKLQLIYQARKNQRFAYVNQLVIQKEPASSKNLQGDLEGKHIPFFNPTRPKDRNTVQVFQKYILVKKEDKVIVNIQKDGKQNPVNVWGISPDSKTTDLHLIVNYDSGRIVCYKISAQDKTYTILWQFQENEVTIVESGELKQAEQVDLQEEQKLIEQGQAGSKAENEATKEDLQTKP